MNGYSTGTLLGNMVHAPEVKYTGKGTAYCNVALAVNKPVKSASGAWSSEVHYFDAVVWGKQAENLAQHKKKGDALFLSGDWEQQRWEATDSGKKRSRVVFNARSVIWLPSSHRDERQETRDEIPPAVGDAFPRAEPVGNDDIPF